MGSLWFLYRRLALVFALLLVSLVWYGIASPAGLNLNWTDVSDNEDGFKIERMSSDGTFVQIATAGANTKSYTDSGLTAGVTYCYVVRAYNSAGSSDPSNGACATVKNTTSTSNTTSSTTTTSTSNSGPGITLTLQSTESVSSNNGSGTSLTGSSTPPAVSYVGGKWKDYKVTLKMKSMDRDSIGVMFRYLDNNNYYRFSWNRQSKLRRLEKIQNGVVNVLARDSVRYGVGRTYQLEIVAQGATLKVWIDRELIFSVDDPSFTEGGIALYSSNNQGSIFDDVLVENLTTGAVLLSEDFNDVDFNGWTIIDDKGTSRGPSIWSIQGGALVQSSNIGSNASSRLGTFALYTKGSWTNYQIAMKIKSLDNDCVGLMFRYQDNNNYYRFGWCIEGDFRRRLDKIENGAVTVLAEDSVPYVTGRDYQLEIVSQETTLQIRIDGASIFSVTDSSFAGGTIALYSYYNQGAVFDDILVEDVATGAVLLWDAFNGGNLTGWTIVDEGAIDGPSVWSAESGALVQNSNIGSYTSGKLGTFALY